jgi:hypothetical protein
LVWFSVQVSSSKMLGQLGNLNPLDTLRVIVPLSKYELKKKSRALWRG